MAEIVARFRSPLMLGLELRGLSRGVAKLLHARRTLEQRGSTDLALARAILDHAWRELARVEGATLDLDDEGLRLSGDAAEAELSALGKELARVIEAVRARAPAPWRDNVRAAWRAAAASLGARFDEPSLELAGALRGASYRARVVYEGGALATEVEIESLIGRRVPGLVAEAASLVELIDDLLAHVDAASSRGPYR